VLRFFLVCIFFVCLLWLVSVMLFVGLAVGPCLFLSLYVVNLKLREEIRDFPTPVPFDVKFLYFW